MTTESYFSMLNPLEYNSIKDWIECEIFQPIGAFDGYKQTCSKCGHQYIVSNIHDQYKCPQCTSYIHSMLLKESSATIRMNVIQITCLNSLQAVVKHRVSINITKFSKNEICIEPYSIIIIKDNGDIITTHRLLETGAEWQSNTTFHEEYDQLAEIKKSWKSVKTQIEVQNLLFPQMQFTEMNIKRGLKQFFEKLIRLSNQSLNYEQFQNEYWAFNKYEESDDEYIWMQSRNLEFNILPNNINIVDLFSKVSSIPALETILKNNDDDFIYFIKLEQEKIEFFFPIYCICMRHSYQIKDLKLWTDTVLLLKEAGMDYHNPKYVCPDSLIKIHNNAYERIQKKEVKEYERKKLLVLGKEKNDSFWYLSNNQDECLKAAQNLTYLEDLKHKYGCENYDIKIMLYNYKDIIAENDVDLSEIATSLPQQLAIPQKIVDTDDDQLMELVNNANLLIYNKLFHAFRKSWAPVIDEIRTIRYKKNKKAFLNLRFVNEDIEIVFLNSIEEFKREGHIMRNCLYHNKYYDENSLIFSVRESGRPVADLEIDLNTFEVLQCCGVYNYELETDLKKKIMDIINQNIYVLKECRDKVTD